MTCSDVRETFSDLHDGLLSGTALTDLTRHLEGCPSCQTEWVTFQRAVRAVADLGSAEPSPGFGARVRQQLEAPAWPRRLFEWLFLPFSVKVPIQAAALVLVAFAGLFMYQQSPELRRGAEFRPPTPPPAAREALDAPGAPVPVQEGSPAPREMKDAQPPADSPKAERVESQALPSAIPPPAAGKAARKTEVAQTKADAAPPHPADRQGVEEDRGLPSRDVEAKGLGKIAAPQELPKAPEPSQESAAERPGSGIAAARRLQQSPPPGPSLLRSRELPAQAKEGGVSPIPTKPADELFAAALADLTRQGYDEAIANLRSFVTRYPRDPRVADARLRLGDAFSAMRRYAEAISEYEAVIQSFPDSPLVPAALYRQGQARLALGDQTGCRLFRDVAGRFPQSPEASLARQALSSACQ